MMAPGSSESYFRLCLSTQLKRTLPVLCHKDVIALRICAERNCHNLFCCEAAPRAENLAGVAGEIPERREGGMVPGGGVEPPRYQVPADFESAASASSAIPAERRAADLG